MKQGTFWTPQDRLRPLRPARIDYLNGKAVVRQTGVRLDPAVTPTERWFDERFWPLVEGLVAWVVIPAVFWYFALTWLLPAVYSFAFHHPFWH